jgi:hypothetical protein
MHFKTRAGRLFVTGAIVASALLGIRCGSNDGGDKCDVCTRDSDCSLSKGYVCERYTDGISRCGDPSRPSDRCP